MAIIARVGGMAKKFSQVKCLNVNRPSTGNLEKVWLLRSKKFGTQIAQLEYFLSISFLKRSMSLKKSDEIEES